VLLSPAAGIAIYFGRMGQYWPFMGNSSTIFCRTVKTSSVLTANSGQIEKTPGGPGAK
jgi:hypothetical protein